MVALHATARTLSLCLAVACLVIWPIPGDADAAQAEFEQIDPSEHVSADVSSLTPVGATLRRRRGRPRKFNEPSRAVTLTLPEAVIERLAAIDRDLSRAVAEVVGRPAASSGRRAASTGRRSAELSVFGDHAVITVTPTRALERRAGIDLVPLPDGRALISFDQPTTISDLELLLCDALDDRTLLDEDRHVFEGIAAILKEARRSEDVALLHRSIIVLRSSPQRRVTVAIPRGASSAKRSTRQRRRTP